LRGIRGAITVEANTAEAILAATRELLLALQRANGFQVEEIASIFFTATPDLNAQFPALAARQLGWTQVPLLCSVEMDVPTGVPRVIRVLVHWNTDRRGDEIVHVYLRDAARLRPDLLEGTSG
jgi:chorismate mutase